MKKNFERLEFLISKLGRGLPFREADCYRYSVFYIFLLQCNIPRPTYPKDSPIKNVQIKNGKKTNGPSLPKPSMGNKRLTQVKSESNMEDCTPLRSVHNLFFLFPNRERYLKTYFLGTINQKLQSMITRRILHLTSKRNKDGHVWRQSDHWIIL